MSNENIAVVSEDSKNSVDTPDNMSTTQLLQKLSEPALEVEEVAEEVEAEGSPTEQPTNSSEDESQTEETQEEDTEADGSPEIETSEEGDKVVLSKSAFDKMQKRIDKLTARAKGGEEDNDLLAVELRAMREERTKATEEKSTKAQSKQLMDVVKSSTDVKDLVKLQDEAREAEDWADDILLDWSDLAQQDENGREFIESNGNVYTKESLKTIKKNAKNVIREIPKREEAIIQTQEYDKQAEEVFPEFKDPESNTSKYHESILSDPQAGEAWSKIPNAKYLTGLLLAGYAALEAQSKPAKEEPKEEIKEDKAPPPIAPRVSGVDDTPVPTQRKTDKEQKSKARNQLTSTNMSSAQLSAFLNS